MKIIIIDDDPAITELLTLMLASEDTEIISANSSEEGIDLVRTENPDIVILDYMMPIMDGIQVCKSIRQFSNVPILVLSALNSPEMAVGALNAGADDYLVKPLTTNMLLAQVNKHARRNNRGARVKAVSTLMQE